MRRMILAAVLFLATMPAVFAHGPKWKRHRHHRPQPRVAVQYYRPWTPGYAVIPAHYRSRFRPVPASYYRSFGPVPRGCRRAMIDGYVVDYRPQNFFVVSFGRAW